MVMYFGMTFIQETMKPLKRDKPSSKARAVSHLKVRKLFNLLDLLLISHPWYTEEENRSIDYKGWRDWVNRHTPPDKRGGPSNH